MLVLTRKVGETVVIGGGIVVKVLDAGGGRVRIGVDAPDEVLVLRGELAARLELDPVANGANSTLVLVKG